MIGIEIHTSTSAALLRYVLARGQISIKELAMWRSHMGDWGSNFCGFGIPFGQGYGMFGWLFMILFWAAIVYLVISIFRHILGHRTVQDNDSSFEILRNRFASGEISEDEYLARKGVLGKK